jgi:hypothetical protein
MPFPSLLDRLKEKTRGRILYSDPVLDAQENLTQEQWEFAHCCVSEDQSDEKLWVELVIETEEKEPAPVKKKPKPASPPRPRTKRHIPE